MVKFYESTFNYDYSFPAVTLAYFLRYPNPYSTHVLSTDVISRDIDANGRLHTVRIHRKRTRLPSTVLKFLPHSVLGSVSNSSSESFVLERSIVDIKEGWMRTESKNLDWTGILSVVEKQVYSRQMSPPLAENKNLGNLDVVSAGTTGVVTTVIFRSCLGSLLRAKSARTSEGGEITVPTTTDAEGQPKRGFLANWSAIGVQRSIEAIASRRTENHLGKSKKGMVIVLERLRSGGLMAVLEGMRKDREVGTHPLT